MSAALGIGLVVFFIALAIGLFILAVWFLAIGVYDTFFANKASFWSILYIILGVIMLFGGKISAGARNKRRVNYSRF